MKKAQNKAKSQKLKKKLLAKLRAKKLQKGPTKQIKKVTKSPVEPIAAAAVAKKGKQVKIKRKIEDFNKFFQEKQKLLLSRKKKLVKKLKLDKNLVEQAIVQLKAFSERTKQTNPLFEVEDGFFYIEVTMNRLPEGYSIRPVAMYANLCSKPSKIARKLPNAIYSTEYFSKHCIFVRAPQREFKDKIQDLDIPCFAKVRRGAPEVDFLGDWVWQADEELSALQRKEGPL